MLIDEKADVLKIIEEKDFKKNMWKKAYLLCKYWNNEGMEKVQMIQEVDGFLKDNYKGYNQVKMIDKLETIINGVIKHNKPMILVERVSFTKEEMELIEKLPKKQLRRLAFVILYHAKLTKEKYDVEDDVWLNDGVNKYCNQANIYETKQHKMLLMSELQDLGLLSISQSLREFMYKVNYIKDGNVVFEIETLHDDKELINYYFRYIGENIKECVNCGRLIKPMSLNSNVKYCRKCAKDIKIKNTINSKKRNLLKT